MKKLSQNSLTCTVEILAREQNSVKRAKINPSVNERNQNTVRSERGFFHVSKEHADAPEVTAHEYSTGGLTSELGDLGQAGRRGLSGREQ